jgi:hypothetical protein
LKSGVLCFGSDHAVGPHAHHRGAAPGAMPALLVEVGIVALHPEQMAAPNAA